MKRISYVMLIALFGALLAACGGGTTGGTGTQGGEATTAPTTAAVAEATATTGTAAEPTATTEAMAEPTATTAAAGGDATATPAASTGGEGDVIKIFSSLPRQGASKSQTDAVVNSIKMVLDENSNAVCNGQFKIEYTDLDDATAATGSWDAATETDNANKAVADPDVMVYIGTFNSGAAKLSMPILNQAGLVMISPANTYTGLTKPGKGEADEPNKYFPSGTKNYVRVVTADDVQGGAAANWAKELGATSVYILDDTQVYGKGVADVFETVSKEIGLTVLGRDGIDGKASDFKALATKLADLKPDLIYFGGIVDNRADVLLKDIREVMPDVKFMGPDGINTQSMIDGAGADVAEGMYTTQAGIPNEAQSDKYKKYIEDYTAKFGSAPESYGVYGYESAAVAVAALNKACAKDRKAVLDAVFATKDFDGALGKWSFDENGDTTLSTIIGYIVKDGKFEQAKVFTGE
jgi:branched-chain amino acid transport system substrate-binding protein